VNEKKQLTYTSGCFFRYLSTILCLKRRYAAFRVSF